MKVLIIDEWIPWPLESGKKIRTFNLVSRLAGQFNIIYLAYSDLLDEKDKIDVMKKKHIHVIPVRDLRIKKWSFSFYVKVILNLFSNQPFSSVYHITDEYIVKLKNILEKESPDLVHCEWTNYAPFLEYVKRIPTVIASHNVESDIWRRFSINTNNLLTKVIAKNQAKKIENLERKWYPMANHCTAVSKEDKAIIESYGANVTLVDNGVDLSHYSSYRSEGEENRLLFTASFDTFSNQDAVFYFLNDIYPIIKREKPDIHFWLVGKDPIKKIRNLNKKDSSIHVTGTVSDVRDYISKAAICVVPLRIGGGSRLKILESMAMGKPVVSTTIGAEGLMIEDGENIMLADQPDDFAKSVLCLLNNKIMQKSISDAAINLVKASYDWGALAEKQSFIWKNTVDRFVE